MSSSVKLLSKCSCAIWRNRGRGYRHRKRSAMAFVVLCVYSSFSLVIFNCFDPTISKTVDTSQNLRLTTFKRNNYDICIAGAGLSGSVIGEQYASEQNKSVLIVEKRYHIGGNCYDEIDHETGLRVSKYGAHIFHTRSDRVWEFVNRFSEWTLYKHEVVGAINGNHVPIPVNIETVNTLLGLNISNSREMEEWLRQEQVFYARPVRNSEEMALSRVGRGLYRMIFQPYTMKQWGKHPRNLDPEVTARIPVRNDHNRLYFDDPHQALPSNGYTSFFQKMLDNPNIEVHLQTDFFSIKDIVTCGKTYFTGPIDSYFDHAGLEKLEYRSLEFERRVLKNVGYFQPRPVVNYPSRKENFTRIVEYKHFLDQKSPHTVIFLEHSKDRGEPYYPVPNSKNKRLYREYQKMAESENVFFVGRLASYKYFNMDEAILNSLEIYDNHTRE